MKTNNLVPALSDPVLWTSILSVATVRDALLAGLAGLLQSDGKFRAEWLRRFGPSQNGAVLSNTAIKNALKSGRLQIDPSPLKWTSRRRCENPLKGTGAVTLHLSDTLVELPPDLRTDLEQLRESGIPLSEHLRQHGKVVKLRQHQRYWLTPGKFVLVQTAETIHFPLTPPAGSEGEPLLCGMVSGRTKGARAGVSVERAFFLHPGDHHAPTLELTTCRDFALVAGMAIANLIVLEVKGVPEDLGCHCRGQRCPCGGKDPLAPDRRKSRNRSGKRS